jgi:hypothetical protein
MTTRSTRLAAFLVLLIVLASGVSLASSGPALTTGGMQTSTSCRTDHVLLIRGPRHTNYSPIRMAQHCRCCGKDENGHCNHQCCD